MRWQYFAKDRVILEFTRVDAGDDKKYGRQKRRLASWTK
jgi:hypothetical protein